MSVSDSKKAQRELQDRAREKESQRVNDLKWLMAQPQGRRFMFNLLDARCLLFSASYTGNSETYLREGKRSVAIDLTKELQQRCPNEYVQMISEAFGEQRRDVLYEQIAQNAAKEDDE